MNAKRNRQNTKYHPAYGLSRAQWERLTALANDPEIKRKVNLHNLGLWSVAYVQSARDLAKDGKKDHAREWWKFLNNSCIADILIDGGAAQAERFVLELGLLKVECHPLDVPNFITDLHAIRFHLEAISKKLGVRVKKEPAVPRPTRTPKLTR